MLYFTTLARSPRCTDFKKNRFGGISPGRNNMFTISYQPVTGFLFCEGSNFAISHKKAWSTLTWCLHYRAACDRESLHDTESHYMIRGVITWYTESLHDIQNHYMILRVITWYTESLHDTQNHYMILRVITWYWESLHDTENHYMIYRIITWYWESLHDTGSHYMIHRVITWYWESLRDMISHVGLCLSETTSNVERCQRAVIMNGLHKIHFTRYGKNMHQERWAILS